MTDRNKDLNLDDEGSEGLTDKRIKDLSSKVKMASEERDTEATARKTAEAEKVAAQKEVEFYKGFSTTTATYPNAKDHVEDIKLKVLAGYSVEDATVSVLAKAGKLTTEPIDKIQSGAGGSASSTVRSEGGKKDPWNMSQADRRAALVDLESKGEFSAN